MRWFFRLSLIVTFAFLVLSLMMLVGTFMTVAFRTEFTVRNDTGESLLMTPISTRHSGKSKDSLRIVLRSLPLPAMQYARFPLASGGTLRIAYDMDDADLSELVLEDEEGRFYQMKVEPGHRQTDFIIDDLRKLGAIDPEVNQAVLNAQELSRGRMVWFYLLLFAPTLCYLGLSSAYSRWEKQQGH